MAFNKCIFDYTLIVHLHKRNVCMTALVHSRSFEIRNKVENAMMARNYEVSLDGNGTTHGHR